MLGDQWDITVRQYSGDQRGRTIQQSCSFKIKCNKSAPVTVALNAGLNGGGVIANRKMKRTTLPAVFLGYQIYQDPANTMIFGNGAGQTESITTSGSTPYLVNVYGQVPSTTADPGIYKDTVTVTITF